MNRVSVLIPFIIIITITCYVCSVPFQPGWHEIRNYGELIDSKKFPYSKSGVSIVQTTLGTLYIKGELPEVSPGYPITIGTTYLRQRYVMVGDYHYTAIMKEDLDESCLLGM